MKHCPSLKGFSQARKKLHGDIGFVPTMGALHEGHISLIKKAISQCEHSVVSIFVNPTQFGPTEDFEQYPRQLDDDLKLCKSLGVDIVFTPSDNDIYPNGTRTAEYIPKKVLAEVMCGKKRPQFFYGICNVVARLFRIISPTHAFFGDKDLQQKTIIRQMVNDLELPISIIGCPIIRDKHGLALSSRNTYLSEDDYKKALVISKTLTKIQFVIQQVNGIKSEEESWSSYKIRQYVAALIEVNGLKGEYVEIFRPDSGTIVNGTIQHGDHCCVAAVCNQIRLIDNICL